MVALLQVTLKDAEKRSLKREFLIYESFQMDEMDPMVSKCVKETLDEFKGEAEDIGIKATMVLK